MPIEDRNSANDAIDAAFEAKFKQNTELELMTEDDCQRLTHIRSIMRGTELESAGHHADVTLSRLNNVWGMIVGVRKPKLDERARKVMVAVIGECLIIMKLSGKENVNWWIDKWWRFHRVDVSDHIRFSQAWIDSTFKNGREETYSGTKLLERLHVDVEIRITSEPQRGLSRES